MRHFALSALLLLSGCVITQSAATIIARPIVEADGHGRAIRVSLDADVANTYPLYADSLVVEQWRQIVGNAFVHGLRDTFVVVQASGPEVLELKVHRLEPRAVVKGLTLFGQADYFVTLELPEGQSLGRAADVVEGPTTVAGEQWKQFDPMLAGTLEKAVRESCAKLLPKIPPEFPRSQSVSLRTWKDSPAPVRPEAPRPAKKCVASALPQWKTASAVEKRALLDECR